MSVERSDLIGRRCVVLDDGTLIPGCYGALSDECTCITLEDEVARLRSEVARLRSQLAEARQRASEAYRAVRRMQPCR